MTIGCNCGASWPGTRISHCSACHLTFTSVTTFDKHRRGFSCTSPSVVGLEAKIRPYGTVYGSPSVSWWTKDG